VSSSDPAVLVDIHNHLVPGVDDGAKSVADVLESVERMSRASIRRVITTPHIDGSLTLDPTRLDERLTTVTSAWEVAAQAVGERFPDVEFRRGHEVLLDVPHPDFSDDRIRMAGTSFVLVEWPRLHLPVGTEPVLARIREAGYRPIVAHPERYRGVGESIEIVGRWREAGAFLQMNYGSLVGRYGSRPQDVAYRLLRRGWIDYMASDFHGHAHLSLYKTEAWEALSALGADEMLDCLCRTNPARVLTDEEPLAVPTLPPERGFWARLRGMIDRSPA